MKDLFIFGGSLITILVVSWLVRSVGLGVDARVRSKDQAFAIANSVMYGFDGVDAVIDRAGYGAIVRNAAGQQMLIRAHGNFFVGRLIDGSFTGRLSQTSLTLESSERRFGSTTLELGKEAQLWTSRLREVLR